MQSIDNALDKLNKSKFRASFYLSKKDIEYINKTGINEIEKHAKDFVKTKIAITKENDGKQTPYKGHPVFKSMHATACCCRGCLNKWYKVPLDAELSDEQQQKIVNLLMAWINRQISKEGKK